MASEPAGNTGVGLTQRLVVGLIGLIAIVCSIADAAGVFDQVPWLAERREDIIILILGLVAGFLALHSSSTESIRAAVDRLSEVQQTALDEAIRLIDGEDATYREGVSILSGSCKSIFLMQRSATLALGPEAQLPSERLFYNTLLRAIGQGATLSQVISLDGIREHLRKEGRDFSAKAEARRQFQIDAAGHVAIKAGKARIPLKKIRNDNPQVKPNKQARTLLVEHDDGTYEGLFVFDLGSTQSCVRVRGPRLETYMRRALDFHRDGCDFVSMSELDESLNTTQA